MAFNTKVYTKLTKCTFKNIIQFLEHKKYLTVLLINVNAFSRKCGYGKLTQDTVNSALALSVSLSLFSDLLKKPILQNLILHYVTDFLPFVSGKLFWDLYHKTYYGRNLRFPQQAGGFVPGKPFQPSQVLKDKHSSLLRKPYITAVMSFMIQAPVSETKA